jgi:hypothetical protein
VKRDHASLCSSTFFADGFAMPNPWDPLPFPLTGDPDFEITYAGVGMVTSQWEAIEFDCARLYSVFVGDPDGEALRAYGEGKIFRDRRINLEKAAAMYFIKHIDQNLEGEFARICATAEGFAERRNEVAHGLVLSVAHIPFFADKLMLAKPGEPQFLLVPPYHTIRNHVEGLPKFAFNKAQMGFFATRMIIFGNSVALFRQALMNAKP